MMMKKRKTWKFLERRKRVTMQPTSVILAVESHKNEKIHRIKAFTLWIAAANFIFQTRRNFASDEEERNC